MFRRIAESGLGFCRAFFVAEFCLSLLPFKLSKRANQGKGPSRAAWVESATAKVTQLDHGGCPVRSYAPEAGQDLGIDLDRLPGVVSFELRKNLDA